MPQTLTNNKSLAEAVTKMVNSLHSIYPGIKVAPISNYKKDEDFTVEIVIPRDFSIDQVEETCHKKCIKIGDEYDLFILPNPEPKRF